MVEQKLRILLKQECTQDLVRLLPRAALTMNSQRSWCTGFTPDQLLHGGWPAWFCNTPFPEDIKSPVGDWLEHKKSLANQAEPTLIHVWELQLNRQKCLRQNASLQVGDFVLVHHLRLPSWPRKCRTVTLGPIASSG